MLCTVLGITVACLVARFDTIGFVLLGAWFGATSSLILGNIIVRGAVAAFLLYKMWKVSLKLGLILAGGLVLIPLIHQLIPSVVLGIMD